MSDSHPLQSTVALPVRDERRVDKVGLQHSALVSAIVSAVTSARGSDVCTMDIRAQGHHVLMNHTAHDRIHAPLICLTKTHILCEVVEALRGRVVLSVGPVTVGRCCGADAFCEQHLQGGFDGAGAVDSKQRLAVCVKTLYLPFQETKCTAIRSSMSVGRPAPRDIGTVQ